MTGDALGPGVQVAVDKLRPGDLLLLENLRFHAEEEANDPEFAESLAEPGRPLRGRRLRRGAPRARLDGGHHPLPAGRGGAAHGARGGRPHPTPAQAARAPSTPSSAGPRSPASSRCSSALLTRCQAVLLGGGMANTFLAAKGVSLGKSLIEPDQLENASRIMDEARRKRVRLMLPTDAVVAPQIHPRARTQTVPIDEVPKDQMVVDIGPATLKAYTEHLSKASTVFWNGPMGVFEVAADGRWHERDGEVPRQASAGQGSSSSSVAETPWRRWSGSGWPTG